PARRGEVIELRRAHVDERRDQHHVGTLRLQERLGLRRAGQPAFEPAQHAADRSWAKSLREPHDELRRALTRTTPQMRRAGITGVEEAQIVEAKAETFRQLGPRTGVAPGRFRQRDAGIGLGNPLHHPSPTERFLAIGRKHDLVTARGKAGDGRLEQPQVRIVPRDEENLHGTSISGKDASPGTSAGSAALSLSASSSRLSAGLNACATGTAWISGATSCRRKNALTPDGSHATSRYPFERASASSAASDAPR